jgi:3-oxoacyl-[acyl-carrier protein] reductase
MSFADSFVDKVAVVTGAGQGIGQAYARALADVGARVVVADINDESAGKVADEINGEGGSALALGVDVADPDSARNMVQQVVGEWGGVDYLVNNAAIYHGMKTESLMKVDLDYYHRFIEVNLHGALLVTRACYRSMRERGGGAIVNQSSTAAWMSSAGYYSVAKAGLNSLTACLAAELAPFGIRVNAIAPGPTDTSATRSVVPEMYIDHLVQTLAIKRLGQPEDLTGACLFLLSDAASWLTGHVIPVDGGQTVRI